MTDLRGGTTRLNRRKCPVILRLIHCSNIMKRYRLHLITAILLFAGGFAATSPGVHAQTGDRRTLSLTESIEMAQRNSARARALQRTYNIALWQHQSFSSSYLPQLNLSGDIPGLTRSITAFRNAEGEQFSQVSQTVASADLGISQRIPLTGADLRISSGLSNTSSLTTDATQWRSNPFSISLTQPLFRFNDQYWERKIEPMRRTLAERTYVEEMERIAVDISDRFFNLYISRMNLESARFNKAINDTIFRLSQGRFRVGSIAENDLLQSELAFMNAEMRVSDAELNYGIAQRAFARAVGLSPDDVVDVSPPPLARNIELGAEQAVALALQHRSEVLGFELQDIETQRDVERSESEAGFNATISASLGFNQTSDEFQTAYNNLLDAQRFSVSFSMPLLDWGGSGAQQQIAFARRQQALDAISEERLDFEQQVFLVASQFLNAQRQISIAAKSDTIARKRFEVAKNRYLIGKIGITDLFQAQAERDGATQGYIQALGAYWTAFYRLRWITMYDFLEQRPLVSGN